MNVDQLRMLPKLQQLVVCAICLIGSLSIPCSAANMVSVTGFGGAATERARDWDGQTIGIAASVMKVFEVDTGFLFNSGKDFVDWYGNAGFRFQAPLRTAKWFAPYLTFGVGKLGAKSTSNGGFGLTLGILRLDYRYIWIEETRKGINRAYVGLEVELNN